MKRYIILLLVLFFTVPYVKAQQVSDDVQIVDAQIAEMLQKEGFEDISICMVQDTLYLSIEDRTHRGTFRGAAIAIQQIAAAHQGLKQFEVVLTDYKTPQLIVHASKREGLWDVSVDRQFQYACRLLKQQTPVAPSTAKVDITVYPMVSLVNNKLDHLFDYSVRLAPAFAMTFWRGSRLTFQTIIPIAHNLNASDTKSNIQLGCFNLSQQLLSTKHWHISSAIGFFHPERMGIETKVIWHSPLRGLDFSVDAGYTGLANNDEKDGFGVNKWNRFNIMAKADYYEPHSKLQIELQGGQFLFGDKGGRLDITRHFGEYAIGVYGILTGGEHNAGFHFAIPLGGKQQKRREAVRLRLPEYYSMEYFQESYFKYWLERMGETYSTQPDDNHSAHYWEPDFVEEYVQRMLNGTFQ